MGPKRSTRAAQRTPSNLQSKLSFQSRVTKPGAAQQAKTSKKDPALLEDVFKAEAVPDDEVEVVSEKAADEDAAAPDPLQTGAGATATTTEDVLGGRAEQSEAGAVGGKGSGWVGEEEDVARKITDTQIKKYWRGKEQERWAPRVHQEDLSMYEKVLREWDMTAKYGPCIGIARLKRWKRANLLGLNPPIEVLAVLLKQMDSGDAKVQRAHVDELMSSRFTTEV